MKTMLSLKGFLVLCVLCVTFASPVRATLIYDNSTNDVLQRFDPGAYEVGDEISLKQGSTERYLTNFSFEFWATNSLTGVVLSEQVEARVRFYLNDGDVFHGYRSPGSMFYDSGWFPIIGTPRATMNFGALDFCSGLFMPVVSNMTWSVQFRGMGENDYAGVDIYTPATTGENFPDYWENLGNDLFPYWVLLTNSAAGPMDFAAQMEARDQPAPVNMTPPALTAVKSGPNMLVSWPCDRVGWTLQAQTNAPGAGIVANGTSWHTIPNSQFANSWLFPLTKGSVFCRLKAPATP